MFTMLAPSPRYIGNVVIHGCCEFVYDPNTNNNDIYEYIFRKKLSTHTTNQSLQQ